MLNHSCLHISWFFINKTTCTYVASFLNAGGGGQTYKIRKQRGSYIVFLILWGRGGPGGIYVSKSISKYNVLHAPPPSHNYEHMNLVKDNYCIHSNKKTPFRFISVYNDYFKESYELIIYAINACNVS